MSDSDAGSQKTDQQPRMIGTGSANATGSSATITAPKRVREELDLEDDKTRVVWFETPDGKFFCVPQSQVVLGTEVSLDV